MTDVDEPPVELKQLMERYVHRIASTEAPPYELAIEMFWELNEVRPMTASVNQAVMLWGSLTDAVDGPPRYSRGVKDPGRLMRRAAQEWIALGPGLLGLDKYFTQWREWPDSLPD